MDTPFLLKVLKTNDTFETFGLIEGENPLDAANNAGLYPAKGSRTGFQAYLGEGRFATVDIVAIPKILTREQAQTAIARVAQVAWTNIQH